MTTSVLPLRTFAAGALLLGLLGGAACSSEDDSSPATTTTADRSAKCEALEGATLALITPFDDGASGVDVVEGEAATFTVGGEERRIIVAELSGSGMGGQTVVFAVKAPGTAYAVDALAQELSSLPDLDLGSEWDESIEIVKRCLEDARPPSSVDTTTAP